MQNIAWRSGDWSIRIGANGLSVWSRNGWGIWGSVDPLHYPDAVRRKIREIERGEVKCQDCGEPVHADPCAGFEYLREGREEEERLSRIDGDDLLGDHHLYSSQDDYWKGMERR
jgi:hypothetical protein